MISKFQGDFRFLSNFWPTEVLYQGITYPTVENAYQAAKFPLGMSYTAIRFMKPGDAKRYGRTIPVRKDWKTVKVSIMEDLVSQKFRNSELAKKIKDTFPQDLIEGNFWHDLFWGKCFCPEHKGKGQNNLGKILMQVRERRINIMPLTGREV